MDDKTQTQKHRHRHTSSSSVTQQVRSVASMERDWGRKESRLFRLPVASCLCGRSSLVVRWRLASKQGRLARDKGQGRDRDRENIEERLTKIRNGRCVRQADLEGGLSGCNCSLYTQVCCDFRSNRPRKTSHDIPTTQRRTARSHPSVTLVTPVALPYPRRSSPTPGASTKRADSSTGQDATHGS